MKKTNKRLIMTVVFAGCALSALLMYSANMQTKQQKISDTEIIKVTVNSKARMAYVDPDTGKLTSTPNRKALKKRAAKKIEFEDKGKNQVDVEHLSDGSIKVDLRPYIKPLMATFDDSGKLKIDHVNKVHAD